MIRFLRDEQGVSVVELMSLVSIITIIGLFLGVGGFLLYCIGVASGVL